jgi:hypothetical protein
MYCCSKSLSLSLQEPELYCFTASAPSLLKRLLVVVCEVFKEEKKITCYLLIKSYPIVTCYQHSAGSNLAVEFICEFETIFENILGCQSGASGQSIYEKN